MNDLQTFSLAFGLIGAGLALYLARLHLLARALERRLAEKEKLR